MVKTLKPVGNSLGLIIDRSILRVLGIDQETRLELTVTEDGKGLSIRPVDSDGHRDRVLRSGERMMDIHDETFRKLAQCDPKNSNSSTPKMS